MALNGLFNPFSGPLHSLQDATPVSRGKIVCCFFLLTSHPFIHTSKIDTKYTELKEVLSSYWYHSYLTIKCVSYTDLCGSKFLFKRATQKQLCCLNHKRNPRQLEQTESATISKSLPEAGSPLRSRASWAVTSPGQAGRRGAQACSQWSKCCASSLLWGDCCSSEQQWSPIPGNKGLQANWRSSPSSPKNRPNKSESGRAARSQMFTLSLTETFH